MNNERIKNILEWIFCVIIALIVALLFRYYIGTPTIVQQESMNPTLEQNQRLLLNRTIRTTHALPQRKDIITFEAPSTTILKEIELAKSVIARYEKEPKSFWEKFNYYVLEIGKKSYIKRVIGLPGEHIKIKDGNVYINDELLDESNYLKDGAITDNGKGLCIDLIIPENCIFAMGDNRIESLDSRAFGCIPLDKIESKVWIRITPFDKFGKI